MSKEQEELAMKLIQEILIYVCPSWDISSNWQEQANNLLDELDIKLNIKEAYDEYYNDWYDD